MHSQSCTLDLLTSPCRGSAALASAHLVLHRRCSLGLRGHGGPEEGQRVFRGRAVEGVRVAVLLQVALQLPDAALVGRIRAQALRQQALRSTLCVRWLAR